MRTQRRTYFAILMTLWATTALGMQYPNSTNNDLTDNDSNTINQNKLSLEEFNFEEFNFGDFHPEDFNFIDPIVNPVKPVKIDSLVKLKAGSFDKQWRHKKDTINEKIFTKIIDKNLWFMIFKYLAPKDINNFSMSCKDGFFLKRYHRPLQINTDYSPFKTPKIAIEQLIESYPNLKELIIIKPTPKYLQEIDKKMTSFEKRVDRLKIALKDWSRKNAKELSSFLLFLDLKEKQISKIKSKMLENAVEEKKQELNINDSIKDIEQILVCFSEKQIINIDDLLQAYKTQNKEGEELELEHISLTFLNQDKITLEKLGRIPPDLKSLKIWVHEDSSSITKKAIKNMPQRLERLQVINAQTPTEAVVNEISSRLKKLKHLSLSSPRIFHGTLGIFLSTKTFQTIETLNFIDYYFSDAGLKMINQNNFPQLREFIFSSSFLEHFTSHIKQNDQKKVTIEGLIELWDSNPSLKKLTIVNHGYEAYSKKKENPIIPIETLKQTQEAAKRYGVTFNLSCFPDQIKLCKNCLDHYNPKPNVTNEKRKTSETPTKNNKKKKKTKKK